MEGNINPEKLDTKVELAISDEWEEVRRLRLLSINGKYAEMFGVTDESKKKESERTEEEWRKAITSENEFYMLSKNNSKAIGVLRAWKKAKEGVWHVGQAYIEDHLQDRGEGRKLYQSPVAEILKRGGNKIVTLIHSSNDRSIHLAESFGVKKVPMIWEDYNISEKDRDSFKDFVSMEIDLTDPEVVKRIDAILNAR